MSVCLSDYSKPLHGEIGFTFYLDTILIQEYFSFHCLFENPLFAVQHMQVFICRKIAVVPEIWTNALASSVVHLFLIQIRPASFPKH